MPRFVIQGNRPLKGSITPGGNKNAVLPILAACILSDQPIILRNVPAIRDVGIMLEILASLGVTVEGIANNTYRIYAKELQTHAIPEHLCKKIRASILFAGALLGRLGKAELFPPGGDIIGRRRVDTHVHALKALGCEIDISSKFLFQAPFLTGISLLLEEASVTATENVIMAACKAQGTTILRNAACEPHVQELCRFLQLMGAKIEGIGSNILTITGVKSLLGCEYTIESDYLEVGSFIGLAACTHSEILIKNAIPDDCEMMLWNFYKLGIRVEIQGKDIFVPSAQDMKIRDDIGNNVPTIDDAPWPGFPADMMSVAIVTAAHCRGTILFHEKMFESRLYFVDKLISMGARIILCDPHRCIVQGPNSLEGQKLTSPDIRAGMALLIAALAAKGVSVIHNIEQIERGYENIEEKLQSLGAEITREKA